ncbi:MAG: TIGR04372 family glycosyltransferase [Desulfomonilaceae bacterium]
MKQKLRSIVRKLFKVMLLPVAVPVLLIIRLIRPLFLVRIGVLISGRIGHFAANTELYLCERDAGINVPSKRYIDLWYHGGIICNKQLALMWKRELFIWPSILLSLLDRLNGLLPGYEVHRIGNNSQWDRDVHNLLDRFPPHLRFLPDEEKQGQAGIKGLGIPEGSPFVCLNVRDSAYLDKMYPENNWRYHDYRDSNISNYVLAAQNLSKMGYYVIRMGAIVKDPFPISHPMIIDYATNGMRSDFMDIYLGAKCHFVVSTQTGLDAIPYVFRRPILYVNVTPIEYMMTFSFNFLIIMKKHKLLYRDSFMTFREIFESGAGRFLESKPFEENGIELIENSLEEIADVVLEMEACLTGTWESTEEDEELQKRFWDIFPKDGVSPYNERPLHGEIRSRIGAEFLRQNKALLE